MTSVLKQKKNLKKNYLPYIKLSCVLIPEQTGLVFAVVSSSMAGTQTLFCTT